MQDRIFEGFTVTKHMYCYISFSWSLFKNELYKWFSFSVIPPFSQLSRQMMKCILAATEGVCKEGPRRGC